MADDTQIGPMMDGMTPGPEDSGMADNGPELPGPELDVAGMQPEGAAGAPAPGQLKLLLVGVIDPAAYEVHPYADALPNSIPREYAELKDSIAVDGLLVPVTLYAGKLLDGRTRCQACIELGVPVMAVELIGTDADALAYVLSANQYRREMTKSQRAAVAVMLLPHITETVRAERLEKVRAAWARKGEGGCQAILPDNLDSTDEAVTSRSLAARMMRVSDGYVRDALRVQQQAPELFAQLHAGSVTLQEALRRIDGETTDAQRREVLATRRQLNRILHNLDRHPDFLKRFRVFLDGFPVE